MCQLLGWEFSWRLWIYNDNLTVLWGSSTLICLPTLLHCSNVLSNSTAALCWAIWWPPECYTVLPSTNTNLSFRNELLPTFWPEYCLNPKSISTTYWHGTKMLNPKSISTTYWHGTKMRQLLRCKFCENYDAPAQNSVCQPHHMSPMYSLFQQLQYAECLWLLQSNKIWPSMDRNLFKPQWYQWTRKSEHYQCNLFNIINGCRHWKWFKDIWKFIHHTWYVLEMMQGNLLSVTSDQKKLRLDSLSSYVGKCYLMIRVSFVCMSTLRKFLGILKSFLEKVLLYVNNKL